MNISGIDESLQSQHLPNLSHILYLYSEQTTSPGTGLTCILHVITEYRENVEFNVRAYITRLSRSRTYEEKIRNITLDRVHARARELV